MMDSEHVVDETLSQAVCDRNIKDTSPHKNTTSASCGQNSFCSVAKSFVAIKFQAFIRSKVPTYLCISLWIFICLLGNIVTGIILCKHHFISDEKENISHLESIENQSTTFDSRVRVDVEKVNDKGFDQKIIYLNESNKAKEDGYDQKSIYLNETSNSVSPFYNINLIEYTDYEHGFTIIRFIKIGITLSYITVSTYICLFLFKMLVV